MNRVKSFFRMPAKIEYPGVRLEFAVSRECTLVSSLAHIYIFWVEVGSFVHAPRVPSLLPLFFFSFFFFFELVVIVVVFVPCTVSL